VRESCVCLEEQYVPLRIATTAGPELAARIQLAVTVLAILTAWVTTLPLGAALGAASLLAFRALSS
jgi:phosphate/sulfate permease